MTIDPLDGLRQEIQISCNLASAPDTWRIAQCQAMERALRSSGPGSVAGVIFEQVFQPGGLNMGSPGLDAFSAFSSLLLSLQYAGGVSPDSVLSAFIDIALTSLFDLDTPLLGEGALLQNLIMPITSLCQSIKATFLVAGSILPGLDHLVDGLVEGLLYQQGRPLKAAKSGNGVVARKKRRRTDEGLNGVQKAVLDALMTSLGSDEQLRARWSRLSELV